MERVNVIEVRENKMTKIKKTEEQIAELTSTEPRTFGYIVGNRPQEQEFPEDLLESVSEEIFV